MASVLFKTLNEHETARRAGIVVQPSDGRAGYVPDSFYGQPSSPVPRAPCPCPSGSRAGTCGLRCRPGRRPGGRRGYRLNATSNWIGSVHPAPGVRLCPGPGRHRRKGQSRRNPCRPSSSSAGDRSVIRARGDTPPAPRPRSASPARGRTADRASRTVRPPAAPARRPPAPGRSAGRSAPAGSRPA